MIQIMLAHHRRRALDAAGHIPAPRSAGTPARRSPAGVAQAAAFFSRASFSAIVLPQLRLVELPTRVTGKA